MKNKKIIYKNFIQKKHINSNLNKNLKSKLNRILIDIYNSQNIHKDVFHSLSKKFRLNFKEKDLIKFKKYNKIILVGMGGSILGSEAIYSFLKQKIKKDFHFFDNLDEDKLNFFKKNFSLNKALFIVISKSGETLETLSNLLALKILNKNSKNLIVITFSMSCF